MLRTKFAIRKSFCTLASIGRRKFSSNVKSISSKVFSEMLLEREIKLGGQVLRYSFTNLAGHGSFLMLALGYLESDVLFLRAYAFSGISLSILFQYYRDKPLWIPIRWNSLFLLINGVMIYLLMNEEQSLSNLPEEMQLLYTNVFSNRGMKPLEFRYLMSIVKKQELRKGERIATENQPINSLFVVSSGELIAMRHNEIVAKITNNQFIGEMSFLKLGEINEQRKHPSSKEHPTNSEPDAIFLSSADVICSEDCTVFSWTFSSLQRLFLVRPGLNIVFDRCISMDLSDKLRHNITGEAASKYKQLLVDILSHQEVSDQSRLLLKELRSKYNISDAIHNSIVNELGWSYEEYEAGHKRFNSAILKYEGLLVAYLVDNTISAEDKELLLEHRQANDIPYKVHLQCLLDHKWTPDEYESGSRL